jgi:hypothetical protein
MESDRNDLKRRLKIVWEELKMYASLNVARFIVWRHIRSHK